MSLTHLSTLTAETSALADLKAIDIELTVIRIEMH